MRDNLRIFPISVQPHDKKAWDPNDTISFPVGMIPIIRVGMSKERGVLNRLMLKTWGGLGDQICAEPTLRYVVNNFENCEISLASEHPPLFRHLSFKRVFDLREEQPIYEKYFLIDTIMPPDHTNLLSQFVNHCTTNAVDFASICSLRCQLPIAEREIVLMPEAPAADSAARITADRPHVVVHAGKHWASKTFPKDWWDAVLCNLFARDVVPVLIGADTDDNRSTVDVDTTGCIDLRNKLSVMESVWLLQNSRVLLTNDSSPLHMAASGDAWIGYVATCKHPDFISHWRRGQWAWRMKNFGLGGIWEIAKHRPDREQDLIVEFVEEDVLRSWLPAPAEIAGWAAERAREQQ